jgi:hypothetical protein
MGWQIVYIPFLFAGDTIINQSGVFIYDGTPTLGNLKVSIAGTAGVDQYGNVYSDNVTAYNIANSNGGYAQIAANPTTGIPFLVLLPPGATVLNAPPQVNASTVNSGLADEQYQINVDSGYGNTVGSSGNAILQLASRSNDSTIASVAKITADVAEVELQDGNIYAIGQLDLLGTALPQTINQTTAQTVTGCTANVVPGTYRIEVESIFTGSAAGAGNPSYQIGVNVTNSLFWGTGIIWQTSGAGAGANRFDTSVTGMQFQGPTMVAAAVYIVKMKGYITVTSTGAISLQAFTSATADSYVINTAALTLTPLK